MPELLISNTSSTILDNPGKNFDAAPVALFRQKRSFYIHLWSLEAAPWNFISSNKLLAI